MQRKRGELVPIGDALSELDGPVTAIPAASPQARYHFTLADQVNRLVAANEADPDMGFMARMLALCSLPRTNPGNRLRYVRRNGPFTLVMNAGGLHRLPFGNFPRLLMAWISTEAVRTGNREIVLGRSLSAFMRKLGINSDSGGKRGEHTRLRNQMKRLFHCTVSLVYEDKNGGDASVSALIARRTEFWWDPKRPDERTLWDSKIELSEDFFKEIIRNPVPLDMNILKAMKRCALGLDLYLWLNYRTFSLQSPLRLSWKQLYQQFGTDPAKRQQQANSIQNLPPPSILRELKKIKTAWPDLNYETAKGVLILLPSIPAIPAIPPVPEPLRLAE